MHFFDSHVHFDRFEKEGLLAEVLQRAEEAGVGEMVAIGGTAPANALSLRLARTYPGRIFGCAGYDRDEALKQRAPLPEPGHQEADAWNVIDFDRLKQQVADPVCRAVGETGLDYYYTADTAAAQQELFSEHCALAAEVGKPLVIHSRDADDDTLAILGGYVSVWKDPSASPGVLHCFTRDRAFARRMLDLGLMISFSGIVTFANADPLREVAAYVPDDRLLIETDSPYLAPVPLRGSRCEPAFVVHTAQRLAELRGVPTELLARRTAENARRLFRL